jgi:hypothetical protein
MLLRGDNTGGRDVPDEAADQFAGPDRRGAGERSGLGQQRGGVDPLGGELGLAADVEPALQHRGREFGVELQAERAPGGERLVRQRRPRQRRDVRGQLEPVEMPLEPRARVDQAWIVALDDVPPDLRLRRPRHLTAQGGGEHLPAEADAKHRHAARDRLPGERDLIADPGPDRGAVVDRPRGPERDDRVVRQRIRERHRDVGGVVPLPRHHGELGHVVTEAGERVADQAARRGVVLLDKENPHERMLPNLSHRGLRENAAAAGG